MVANPRALEFKAFGAALESIQRRYGGLAAVKAEPFQVTTTPSQIVPADPERLFLAIINLSGDFVMIAPDPGVSPLRGIRLSPNGGFITMNERDDTIMPCLEWFGEGFAINLDCYRITVRRDVTTGEASGGE